MTLSSLRTSSPLSDFELGWLCGLLEGEGYFGFGSRTRVVEITMTDEDAVNRAAVLFEKITGKEFSVITRKEVRSNRKQPYRLLASGDQAIVIMRLIVKHMSVRRRKRIWQSLNGFTPKKANLNVVDLVSRIKAAV